MFGFGKRKDKKNAEEQKELRTDDAPPFIVKASQDQTSVMLNIDRFSTIDPDEDQYLDWDIDSTQRKDSAQKKKMKRRKKNRIARAARKKQRRRK